MTVTYFRSLRSPQGMDMGFEEYIKLVKDGISKDYIEKIKEVRSVVGSPQYKKLKEGLPIITPHARVLGQRNDKNVDKHSGIISVDVDSDKNDQKLIDKFEDDVALGWHRTISGRGIVIYYRVDADADTHRSAFETVAQRLKKKFGIIADPHVKALSVPRFISYDPNTVYNPKAPKVKINPKAYVEDSETQDNNERKDPTTEKETIRELTKTVVAEGVGIVNDRESWVKMAALYNRTFEGSEEGLSLFHKISKLSEGYKSKKDCERVYRSFDGKRAKKEATVGSLVYLMEEEGGLEVSQNTGGATIANIGTDTSEETKASWKDYLLTEEPEDEIPIIQFGDINVCTQGNHTLVIGKKKSRKSLFITWLIDQIEDKRKLGKRVLLADTEQGAKHVWKMKQRIKRLTKQDVPILFLRGENPENRRRIIDAALKDMKPELLVIDGIRDLVYDINDPKECTKIVTWVEKKTLEGLHIINVLHLNKTDGNARGHIGSELLNKAETVMELELMQDGEITRVVCEASRDVPFEEFAFTHDLNGLPKIVDIPKKGELNMREEDITERLKGVFAEQSKLRHTELKQNIRIAFEVGEVKAKRIIKMLIEDRYIKVTGTPHSRDQKYVLQ